MKNAGNVKTVSILILMGFLGVVLIILTETWPLLAPSPYHEITRDLGIASMTAFILGLTIDQLLKREIARDVFSAALGYMLPDEFKTEMQRVISSRYVCDTHRMTITLEKKGSDEIRITTEIERVLKNITSVTQPCRAMVHIDEWGFASEKSKIDVCELEQENGSVVSSVNVETRTDSTILAQGDEVLVSPGGAVTVRFRSSEIKRTNDYSTYVCLSPTKNPEIKILSPDDLEIVCGFGGTEEKIEKSRFGKMFVLHGMYFPPASMRVRWFPRAKQVAGTNPPALPATSE